ncbi:MAG: hypothetical protein HY870_10210 [Chloroflexi bacterium]|nr:hypothetical protein [Chloroflexota bacterium]
MTLSLDQIGVILGAILTLFVLSYLIGDNFLYRLATHILIGVGAAYITVTVLADVLWPRLVQPILAQSSAQPPNVIVAGIGLILSAMLLFKALPRFAWLGNIPIGYLVGVGAAVALGGAVFGTLGAQTAATALPPGGVFSGPSSDVNINFVLNAVIAFGTVTTLLSFSFFRAARRGVLSGLSSIGRIFLAIALGATFALVYIASVTVLIDRVQTMSDAVLILFAR